jgi:hypothetical protein
MWFSCGRWIDSEVCHVRSYSLGLRERVLRDVESGESIRLFEGRFDVSPSFVSKLHTRYRHAGLVMPGKQGAIIDLVDRSSS